ncbi:uncharacterized protein LOC143362117 isoform X1 [Halictus rubicundus]|uniref:uncharacterized protein LOC143362117 isoform X1 n=2 Tax=Halictus rubicundus TaxID=77578 RepID=UPI0040361840
MLHTRHGAPSRTRRIHHRSRSTTVRRMGAWVNDRFAEEEVVPINQGPRRRKTSGILGHICDGGGPGGIYQSSKNFKSSRFSPSLLPLRRQFTRQLYEWPCLPLFKSRTKLNRFRIGSTVAVIRVI